MRRLKLLVKISGTVVSGERVGRKSGFPTANLELRQKPKIKPGVYVAVCGFKKTFYLGLAFYSPRQTFEIHLFNFQQKIYGAKLAVSLTHWLRPPRKIKNLRQLKILIHQDLKTLDDDVILVNRQDQPVGIEAKEKVHTGQGRLHRAVSVLIFNQRKQLLIQQRSRQKRLFPLLWANTACTDVRPYESYLQAAQRRLKEEMGLSVQLKPWFKFSYTASAGRTGTEKEIDQVFLGQTDQLPVVNKKEVQAWQYAELESLPVELAPWFKLILKRLPSSDIFNS